MRQAADELAFDQLGIDRAADVIGDGVALNLDAPGVALNRDNGNVDTVGVGHVRGIEIAFDRQAIEPAREIAERERGSPGLILALHQPRNNRERVGWRLQQQRSLLQRKCA